MSLEARCSHQFRRSAFRHPGRVSAQLKLSTASRGPRTASTEWLPVSPVVAQLLLRQRGKDAKQQDCALLGRCRRFRSRDDAGNVLLARISPEQRQ